MDTGRARGVFFPRGRRWGGLVGFFGLPSEERERGGLPSG